MNTIKNVLRNENVKKGLNIVKNTAKKGLKIAIPILEVAMIKSLSDDYKTYDDAVKAIMHSSMFSSDKTEAIAALKMDGNYKLYSGVINVVKSSMFSSDKLETIKRMNEN